MMKKRRSPRTKDPLEFALKSLLAKRQSEQEMRERLQKHFPDADAEAIIARLKELNYIDDREFSQAWVRHRSLGSARGKYVLRQELRRKGIREEDMEEALAEFDEDDVLENTALPKWEALKAEKNVYKRKEKTMRFLLSRGFDIGKVLDMVNTLAQREQN